MKISIITASLNSEATIKPCMISVLEQTYPHIEYLIIDGQSTDDTLDVVKECQDQFPKANIKVISESDKGIYDALNKGIALATGDVLGFVHSDDFLANSKIMETIANQFKIQNIDGVYGDLQYVNKIDSEQVIRYWKSGAFNKKLLIRGWMPPHPTLFLKRAVYKKHSDFNLSYTIAADYDFILRVFKDESLNFTYVPEVITNMRMGGASNRSLKNIINKTLEDYKVVTSNEIGSLRTVVIKNLSKLNQLYKRNYLAAIKTDNKE